MEKCECRRKVEGEEGFPGKKSRGREHVVDCECEGGMSGREGECQGRKNVNIGKYEERRQWDGKCKEGKIEEWLCGRVGRRSVREWREVSKEENVLSSSHSVVHM